jgi:uncharacterized membrane protein YhaH (DUF805 family)
MALGNLLFQFSGRTNRGQYWFAWLIYAVIYFLIGVLGYLSDSMAIAALNSMVTIVLFISSLAVGTKRLHDRNKPGWYLVLFYVLPGILFIAGMGVGMLPDGSNMVATVLGLAGFAISIWAFVELGCLRGTIGINPHGPDPVAPVIVPPVRNPMG